MGFVVVLMDRKKTTILTVVLSIVVLASLLVYMDEPVAGKAVDVHFAEPEVLTFTEAGTQTVSVEIPSGAVVSNAGMNVEGKPINFLDASLASGDIIDVGVAEYANAPVLAYSLGGPILLKHRSGGGNWQNTRVGFSVSEFEIATGGGKTFIVFLEKDSNYDSLLKWGVYDGSANINIDSVRERRTGNEILTENIVPSTLSLYVDEERIPHIVFYDLSDKTLKYAFYERNNWRINPVYTTQTRIDHASIAWENGVTYIAFGELNAAGTAHTVRLYEENPDDDSWARDTQFGVSGHSELETLVLLVKDGTKYLIRDFENENNIRCRVEAPNVGAPVDLVVATGELRDAVVASDGALNVFFKDAKGLQQVRRIPDNRFVSSGTVMFKLVIERASAFASAGGIYIGYISGKGANEKVNLANQPMFKGMQVALPGQVLLDESIIVSKPIDIKEKLQQYIDKCNTPQCSAPVVVTTRSPGIVELSNLNIIYTFKPSIDLIEIPEQVNEGESAEFRISASHKEAKSVQIYVCKSNRFSIEKIPLPGDSPSNKFNMLNINGCTDGEWCKVSNIKLPKEAKVPAVCSGATAESPITGQASAQFGAANDAQSGTGIESGIDSGTDIEIDAGGKIPQYGGHERRDKYFVFVVDTSGNVAGPVEGSILVNRRPQTRSIVVSNPAPGKADKVSCNYDFYDADADEENKEAIRFAWWGRKQGSTVDAVLSQTKDLDLFTTDIKKTDTLWCNVAVEDEHGLQNTGVSQSEIVRVADTPPTMPASVALDKTGAKAGEAITANCTGSQDIDGDFINYVYAFCRTDATKKASILPVEEPSGGDAVELEETPEIPEAEPEEVPEDVPEEEIPEEEGVELDPNTPPIVGRASMMSFQQQDAKFASDVRQVDIDASRFVAPALGAPKSDIPDDCELVQPWGADIYTPTTDDEGKFIYALGKAASDQEMSEIANSVTIKVSAPASASSPPSGSGGRKDRDREEEPDMVAGMEKTCANQGFICTNRCSPDTEVPVHDGTCAGGKVCCKRAAAAKSYGGIVEPSSNTTMIILLIVGIVVVTAGIGVGIWYFLRKRNQQY